MTERGTAADCRFTSASSGAAARSHTPITFRGDLAMPIKVGVRLPEAEFRIMAEDGGQTKTTADIFKGKKVALVAVPGAYTGTCHKQHLPSIFASARAIKDKGVDNIAIVSVNDVFV